MKTMKVWAVLSIAASTVFAVPESGFFIGAEAGKARLKNDDFTVYNVVASPSPEALPSQDTTNNVSVARLTAGYAFTKEWDLRLSYTRFGEGKINFPGPRYPGMVFVTAPDEYLSNVIKYRTNLFTLMPVYSISPTSRLRLNGGLGLNYATTESHFEATRLSFIPRTTTFYRLAGETEHQWSLAVQFGVEYFVMEHLSLGVTADYSEAKAKVPPGWARAADTTFSIKAASVQFAALWHF